jgi:predicted ATPase
MQLHAGLGLTLMQTQGPVAAGAAWANALELAEDLGNIEYRLRALWGLSVHRFSKGEYQAALALAQRFCDLAVESADPSDLLVGDGMMGVLLHYHGEQSEARRHLESMLDHYVTPVKRSPLARFQFDQRVSAQCIRARVLWLQGFPDQAVGAAQSAIENARALDHAVSLCDALAQAACPVALLTGNLAAAEYFVGTLLEQSARYGLGGWNAWGRCLKGALLIRLGDAADGLALLRDALEELHQAGFPLHYTGFLGTLVQGLASVGQVGDALLAIEQVFARSERTEERWYLPELLRLRGELVLLDGAPKAESMAENDFQQALDWAHRQDALSWELRSATSLARLWRDHGRTREAHDLLAPIYHRFTEGFETGDLVAAKALIEALR